MNQLFLFKIQRQKSLNQGFTTLEILVSIIIALAFVSVAMQSFVLAMGMKVQAQEKQRANQLIQEDLERTNILASNIAEDHDAKCFTAAYDDGYAKELRDDLDAEDKPTAKLLKKADGTTLGKTLGLARTHVSDTSSDFPHRTLKINYQVQELDDDGDPIGDVIAQRYVEVIPDVALQCP
jgi:type II secretory pathway pseudopilin PulG